MAVTDSAIGHDSGSASEDEDAALMRRVLMRDLDAFETLYRRYHGRLTRFLSRFIRRPQLIEEALNDTLMVVWTNANSFKGDSKLSTWIFAIAYRTAMKALRRLDEPLPDNAGEALASADAGPEDQSGQARVSLLLRDAIAELSPPHRAVVEFTYFHDMGYREIAAIMDCPVDTVKTRMFHARRHLKQRLAGNLSDWV